MRRDYPETRVAVDEGTADLPARVRSGELHLAVAFQDTGEPRWSRPASNGATCFASGSWSRSQRATALAEHDEVRLDDLAEEDWTVALPDGLIVGACREAGFEPNLVSITRDQLAIRALIARGLAVTLVPQLLADAFENLVLRPIAGGGPGRDVYALLPPGGRHPLVAATLAALDSAAAELT